MVMGHTLEALLSPAARETAAMHEYWRYRGLTAPLFLCVSGWAVATAIARSGEKGSGALRARLPRVALLFLLGYLLRLPTWDLDGLTRGDASVWRHFLAFDALHCVGAALLVAAVACAVTERPALRFALFSGLFVLVPALAAVAWGFGGGASLVVAQSLGGGDAPFPFFPWAGYFFLGATLAALRMTSIRPLFRSFLLCAAGAGTMGVAMRVGLENLPVTSPNLFAWRVGHLLVALGLLALVPRVLGARAAFVGRTSLGVYLLHLPLVYGWGAWDGLVRLLGPTLSAGEALGAGAVILAASVTTVVVWRRLVPLFRAIGSRVRDGALRPGAAASG